MRRFALPVLVVMVLLLGNAMSALAQEATPEADEGGGFELSNSATLLSQLDLPALNLAIKDDGSVDLPDTLESGRYLLTLTGTADRGGEVYFLQPPTGTSEEEAKAAMMSLISEDQATPGWLYGGGAFTLPGQSFSLVIDLEPGEWTVATSVEGLNNEGGIVDVLFQSLTVAGETPELLDIEGAISVEMADFAFTGLDSASSGPQIWKLTNSGAAPHMVSLFKTPRLLSSEDVLAVFLALSTGGTPPAGIPGIEEWQPVGYVQVISPGQSVWIEWTFIPGDYVAICFVAGEDALPHLAHGMAQGFSVN